MRVRGSPMSLLIGGMAIGLAGVSLACGQSSTVPRETQTAQAVNGATSNGAATAVESSAAASTGATSPPPATPAFVTPIAEATAGARTDCPVDWVTFADVGKSLTVCAPSGLFAMSTVTAQGASSITIASDLNGMSNPNAPRVAFSVGLQPSPGLSQLPAPDRCTHGGVPAQVSAAAIDVTVAGQLVAGCHYVGETYSPDGPLESIMASLALPTPAGASPMFLAVTVYWRTNSPGAESVAKQMLAEVRAT